MGNIFSVRFICEDIFTCCGSVFCCCKRNNTSHHDTTDIHNIQIAQTDPSYIGIGTMSCIAQTRTPIPSCDVEVTNIEYDINTLKKLPEHDKTSADTTTHTRSDTDMATGSVSSSSEYSDLTVHDADIVLPVTQAVTYIRGTDVVLPHTESTSIVLPHTEARAADTNSNCLSVPYTKDRDSSEEFSSGFDDMSTES